ncbi:adenylyl-sulfate kinase [Streptomyces desertarenae]|uniref:Adenylyl-sulfate kinase n=1 Tax=Streptomyces desertarenae TaxID=2666184 RepID=A0ABW4PN44_9ACTN
MDSGPRPSPAPRPTPEALLITGTVGAGKTTVAHVAGDLLTDDGVPNAVVDLDALCRLWPSPAGDPFNAALLLRNLRCVAGHHLDAGAVRIVLAGVAESRSHRERYREAVGTDLAVCRLRVHLPTVRRRLVRRHENDPGPGALRWHLDRVGELDRILDRARVEDFGVDAGHGSAADIADAVLRGAGWR